MKATIYSIIYHKGDYEDKFIVEANTIEKIRMIANKEIERRGWDRNFCWTEVEE